MKATFVRENETPLSGCTIRFSRGENSVDYQPNQDGTMTVSGLPAEGQLTVSILDRQADPLGTITLTFSRGAVIDAVTDEDSVGHITLTEDAQEIALCFTLYHDGTLRCQLQLAESRIV